MNIQELFPIEEKIKKESHSDPRGYSNRVYYTKRATPYYIKFSCRANNHDARKVKRLLVENFDELKVVVKKP